MFNYEDICSRAVIHVNQDKPIKGVILSFHGLSCLQKDFDLCEERLLWFQQGWMIVCPNCGAWSWLNDNVVDYVTALIDGIWKNYEFNESTPLICYGGSMGGYAALLYPLLSDCKVSKSIVKFPVCDLEYHRDEREDVKRTLVYAFWNCGYSSWDELFQARSPLCRVDDLPDIPYLFVHSSDDTKVSKAHHSDEMVRKMRERGRNVSYIELSGYDHSEPLSEDIFEEIAAFLD